MLGAKIFLTGALFFALSCVIILSCNYSVMIISYWVKAVLVLTWYGGLAAMIVGTLIAIWM